MIVMSALLASGTALETVVDPKNINLIQVDEKENQNQEWGFLKNVVNINTFFSSDGKNNKRSDSERVSRKEAFDVIEDQKEVAKTPKKPVYRKKDKVLYREDTSDSEQSDDS